MEILFNNISQVLGTAILHSLWQGLVVWGLLRIVFQIKANLTAAARYKMAFASAGIIFAWFIFTFCKEAASYNWHEAAQTSNTPSTNINTTFFKRVASAGSMNYLITIKPYLPYISVIYIIGLLINVSRLTFGWIKIGQIKKGLLQAGAMQTFANKIKADMGIVKRVGVFYSELVDVPCVIGAIKPLILLPLSLPVHLSVEESQAILMHELAHIKRNDYLANLIQQVMSVIMFFNPFVHLINRTINTERENCCDDFVIASQQPLIYAQALLKLEEQRQTNWQLALAATGNKYSLLTRIQRIMNTTKPTTNIKQLVVLLLLFAFSAGSIAWLNPEVKQGKLTIKPVLTILKSALTTDTIKPKVKTKTSVKAKAPVSRRNRISISNGNTIYYGDTSLNGFHDAELERLAKEVEKHGNAIGAFYDNPEYKAKLAAIEDHAKLVQAHYDSPEMKKLLGAQQKQADLIAKNWTNNPDFKRMTAQMEQLGKGVGDYYNKPQFKSLQKKMEEQGKALSNVDLNSPEYKKQLEDFSKLSVEYSKLTASPEIKQQMEKMTQLSAQISKQFTSNPEYLKHQEQLRILSDSIGRTYTNLGYKDQQQKLSELTQAISQYTNNPELTNEQRLLKEAADRLRKYQESPEFKKKMEDYRRRHPNATINN